MADDVVSSGLKGPVAAEAPGRVSAPAETTHVRAGAGTAADGGAGAVPAGRMAAPPPGAFVGPGACAMPPLYMQLAEDETLIWEACVRTDDRILHIGRFLTREVRFPRDSFVCVFCFVLFDR